MDFIYLLSIARKMKILPKNTEKFYNGGINKRALMLVS